MDAQPILNLPFVQVTLPVMFAMWLKWRAEGRQFEEIRNSLGLIDTKLESHEERTSPLHH